MNRFSLLILVSVALSTAQLDRIYKMFQDLHVNPESSCKSCLKRTASFMQSMRIILLLFCAVVTATAQTVSSPTVGLIPDYNTLNSR